MTNRTKSEFTSHCRIAAKMNLLMFFLAPFAHARYSSRMIDRFLNWGDHGKPKSGKIKGRCQPPLIRKIYAASLILFNLTAEEERVLCQLVFVFCFFNCLFPRDIQNEIQLLSWVFCYSWLACLLSFWLRNTSLFHVGNPISNGIIFVFHLAWCMRGLKSLKRYWPLDSFQELHREW